MAEPSQIRFHFQLKVDGQLADQSDPNDPVSFEPGSEELLPGLERALSGMNAGEQKTVTLGPEDAFGPRDPDAVQPFPRSEFSSVEGLQTGTTLQGEMDGEPFQALVTGVTDDQVTLDFNHPLAGKSLEFHLEVVEVS